MNINNYKNVYGHACHGKYPNPGIKYPDIPAMNRCLPCRHYHQRGASNLRH